MRNYYTEKEIHDHHFPKVHLLPAVFHHGCYDSLPAYTGRMSRARTVIIFLCRLYKKEKLDHWKSHGYIKNNLIDINSTNLVMLKYSWKSGMNQHKWSAYIYSEQWSNAAIRATMCLIQCIPRYTIVLGNFCLWNKSVCFSLFTFNTRYTCSLYCVSLTLSGKILIPKELWS